MSIMIIIIIIIIMIIMITRLTYNCAHLRSTKEGLIFEYLDPRVTKKLFDQFSRQFRTFPEENFFGRTFFGGENFSYVNFCWLKKFLRLKFFG